MNYSAVLLVARPQQLDAAVAAASAIPGVEVFQIDPSKERIICVIEAISVEEEIRLFTAIQALPDVLDLSLIEHLPDATDSANLAS